MLKYDIFMESSKHAKPLDSNLCIQTYIVHSIRIKTCMETINAKLREVLSPERKKRELGEVARGLEWHVTLISL